MIRCCHDYPFVWFSSTASSYLAIMWSHPTSSTFGITVPNESATSRIFSMYAANSAVSRLAVDVDIVCDAPPIFTSLTGRNSRLKYSCSSAGECPVSSDRQPSTAQYIRFAFTLLCRRHILTAILYCRLPSKSRRSRYAMACLRSLSVASRAFTSLSPLSRAHASTPAPHVVCVTPANPRHIVHAPRQWSTRIPARPVPSFAPAKRRECAPSGYPYRLGWAHEVLASAAKVPAHPRYADGRHFARLPVLHLAAVWAAVGYHVSSAGVLEFHLYPLHLSALRTAGVHRHPFAKHIPSVRYWQRGARLRLRVVIMWPPTSALCLPCFGK